ncbi:hypothetical protein ACC796_36355, partial [Rhizobium ruizarguesonis]
RDRVVLTLQARFEAVRNMIPPVLRSRLIQIRIGLRSIFQIVRDIMPPIDILEHSVPECVKPQFHHRHPVEFSAEIRMPGIESKYKFWN